MQTESGLGNPPSLLACILLLLLAVLPDNLLELVEPLQRLLDIQTTLLRRLVLLEPLRFESSFP